MKINVVVMKGGTSVPLEIETKSNQLKGGDDQLTADIASQHEQYMSMVNPNPGRDTVRENLWFVNQLKQTDLVDEVQIKL